MKKTKLILLLISAAVVLMSLVILSAAPVGAEGDSGTTLSANVTITPHWNITYNWTIDKSVTPASWNLFRGDSGTSMYTITVTKSAGVEEAWVDGQVCVTNGGAVATQGLAITLDLKNGEPPPDDIIATISVDVSSNSVLDPGETGCYAYHVNIPTPHAGGTYKATANVTITNHAGHLGEQFGPSPSADTIFPASPTPTNGLIHVDDTNGESWEFSVGGSVTYNKTFTCDADEGTHDNTAAITETGQYHDASVTVNCYALEVSKRAKTSLKREFHWTIDKSADQTEITLSPGQQFLVNYSVTVDATYTDSNWAVGDGIEVYNPAPMAATINGVTDIVSPSIPATVNCGVTFPYTLAAGGTLNCTYSASLPDASQRTNTATVTLQNHAYDRYGVVTPTGTTEFTGTADVSFSAPTMDKVDECIDVTDTYAGALGTVCYGVDTLPKTFTYSRWIGPYEICGDYTVENTADFVTNDTGATGSDSWSVAVHVPCVCGCTLTQGYWKTHSKYGPAPYDDTWELLGEDTPFYSSGQSYYEVLWTPPRGGNAYYILAHQYIAAVLNQLKGAGSTEGVDAALEYAESFFDTYTPDIKLSKSVRATALNYAFILDQYNNGYTGPGHCSESDVTPVSPFLYFENVVFLPIVKR